MPVFVFSKRIYTCVPDIYLHSILIVHWLCVALRITWTRTCQNSNSVYYVLLHLAKQGHTRYDLTEGGPKKKMSSNAQPSSKKAGSAHYVHLA